MICFFPFSITFPVWTPKLETLMLWHVASTPSEIQLILTMPLPDYKTMQIIASAPNFPTVSMHQLIDSTLAGRRTLTFFVDVTILKRHDRRNRPDRRCTRIDPHHVRCRTRFFSIFERVIQNLREFRSVWSACTFVHSHFVLTIGSQFLSISVRWIFETMRLSGIATIDTYDRWRPVQWSSDRHGRKQSEFNIITRERRSLRSESQWYRNCKGRLSQIIGSQLDDSPSIRSSRLKRWDTVKRREKTKQTQRTQIKKTF
jgi:hypothetical protein